MYVFTHGNYEAALAEVKEGCVLVGHSNGFDIYAGKDLDLVKRLVDADPDNKAVIIRDTCNASYNLRRRLLDAGVERDRVNDLIRGNAPSISVFIVQESGGGSRVLRIGRYASPEVGFIETTPIIRKKKRLNDDAVIRTFSFLDGEDKAVALYDWAISKVTGAPAPVPFPAPVADAEPAPAPAPAATPAAPAPVDPFMDALRAAFISTVGENLVGTLVPTLKQKVIDEFGFEPQRHEVKIADNTVRFDGLTHQKFDVILNLVANNVPTYMYGPAGSGKGVLVKQVAKALNLDFYAMNSVTDEFKITGFVDANGNYCESEFYRAFTKGGVFFLDEMDASAPEVLVCLNMAIADRYYTFPTGRVDAHSDFRVVAAGNTLGTGADASYTGRLQLDAASLNRFVVIEVGYDRRIDLQEAQNDNELVAFIERYRKVAAKNGINTVASYRNIRQIKVMESFADLKDVLVSCLTKNLNQDDINTMIGTGGWDESNRYFAAFKSIKAFA